jgi:hypothetical protein
MFAPSTKNHEDFFTSVKRIIKILLYPSNPANVLHLLLLLLINATSNT